MSSPALQIWLQRFAWTEQHLESCIRARNELPLDTSLLCTEPMFCFETAVKLLYWCGFVYEHEEVSLSCFAPNPQQSPACPLRKCLFHLPWMHM